MAERQLDVWRFLRWRWWSVRVWRAAGKPTQCCVQSHFDSLLRSGHPDQEMLRPAGNCKWLSDQHGVASDEVWNGHWAGRHWRSNHRRHRWPCAHREGWDEVQGRCGCQWAVRHPHSGWHLRTRWISYYEWRGCLRATVIGVQYWKRHHVAGEGRPDGLFEHTLRWVTRWAPTRVPLSP
jgi:hypothetical protein